MPPPSSSRRPPRSSRRAARCAAATRPSGSSGSSAGGGTAARRSGTGAGAVAALSERELQVARLIVDRRTNPEIAAELFLSTKTVESHVRNLFHKLGVRSRADVARVVEQADRAPASG